MEDAKKFVHSLMEQIIDEAHEWFKPVTDEETVELDAEHAVYTRNFKHQNGKTFKMTWTVFSNKQGDERLVFQPAVTV